MRIQKVFLLIIIAFCFLSSCIEMEAELGEPTPEIMPEPTPEPTSDPTPEITPEPSPEPTSDPTPQITPEPTSDPTPKITPEPSPVSVLEFQTFETSGAYDWEYFNIGDEHFLVISNYYNGTVHNLNSKIYKWNGYNFTLYQNIATSGAYDWEFFSIGDEYFLAVANYYDDTSYNVNSVIYKWESSTEEFLIYQEILTYGARDWEYFCIGDDHYVIVANAFNGSTYNINSEVYIWNDSTFVEYQSIVTNLAADWEYFTIDGASYLVVANCFDGLIYNVNSAIYQWDTENTEFILIQEILTNGAKDWEWFVIDQEYYLAVANNCSGASYNLNSRIYRWSTSTKQFVEFDFFGTNGVYDLEYLFIADKHFIAAANNFNGESYIIDSFLYQLDTNLKQISLQQTIATVGATDWICFSIEDDNFLAVANFYDGSTYNNISTIYKLTY